MKRIKAVLPVVIRDVVGVAGACSVAYGAYQIYQPAGFIVGGALALVSCLLAARGS